jgi:TctA family transporter
MLLGGLLLLGLSPGPSMVTTSLNVTLAIVWSLALANILGTMACLGLSRQVAKLSLIPAKVLTPFLLVIMTVAAYQATRNWGDIVAFVVIGALGWVMKQVGFPRAPMLIGFVLAVSAERYLHLSMSLYGWDWITRPIVLVVFTMIVLVLFGSSIREFRKKRVAGRAARAASAAAERASSEKAGER